MNRRAYVVVIAATLFAALIPGAAKASTLLTYDLALNPIVGTDGGTGSLTIIAPQVGSSGILTQGSGLTALDFKIDGLDFTLNNTSDVAYFYQGTNLVLASIGYSGQIGTDKLFTISLGNLGGYAFNDSGSLTVGSISAVSATPIPQSLPLLATGLGALALLGLWRKRKVGAAIATASPDQSLRMLRSHRVSVVPSIQAGAPGICFPMEFGRTSAPLAASAVGKPGLDVTQPDVIGHRLSP